MTISQKSILNSVIQFSSMIPKQIIVILGYFRENVIFLQHQIFIMMSNQHELSKLIDQITKNRQFVQQVHRCVNQCNKLPQQTGQLPTFAFEKAGKYPWSMFESNMPIEGQKMVEQITDLITNIVDNSLHHILSRQFLNVSNQILVIRDEIDRFTKDEEMKSQKIKEQFLKQVDILKKKMIVQQSMGGVREKQFVRTRTTAVLNSSTSSNISTDIKSDMRGEIQFLKKEVETLKKEVNKSEMLRTIHDQVIYLQSQFRDQMMSNKIKMESIKQKSDKGHQQLQGKISELNNKQMIANQVKRAVKSYFKIYLEQLNCCKANIKHQQEQLARTDKSLQQYVGNQLKSIWVLFSNMKRRVQSIEQNTNMNNQSFILE